MKVLVTGITGFIGSAVANAMSREGWTVIGQSHHTDDNQFPTTKLSITSQTDWSTLLAGVDLVVHCAAYSPRKGQHTNFAKYNETNTKGTMTLAQQAASIGVKRFIFISSVKVNGETSPNHVPFNQESVASPEDDYGVSKLQAEQELLKLHHATSMDVSIIRPPLVYGPGVSSNFTMMLKLVHKQAPLPFGALSNQRSLVFIDNLVDLIITLCSHPSAAGQTFFVSDDHDVSTTELFRTIGIAMNRKARLLPVPSSLLVGCCQLVGRYNIINKLLRSLQVDIESTKTILGWRPPVTFEEGIAITVQDYLARVKE
ncbi:NAD-dependent epimerase/dehydratase family protein [Vibrio sp. CAIM 722]|uniref:NAD-dependent epimerase/dehydratase family protein n=1 Tax=Vibrio eleionomae TaxID=2653505 RepID=A0A7X4LQ30_9VIBR|nr:NAD-dependent epimerase/dehydratase family protein [Vibrio eleionomae]MZI95810.1 NAD-dependent epimerase/dehydratase family protein [Vibrio eleionomae]